MADHYSVLLENPVPTEDVEAKFGYFPYPDFDFHERLSTQQFFTPKGKCPCLRRCASNSTIRIQGMKEPTTMRLTFSHIGLNKRLVVLRNSVSETTSISILSFPFAVQAFECVQKKSLSYCRRPRWRGTMKCPYLKLRTHVTFTLFVAWFKPTVSGKRHRNDKDRVYPSHLLLARSNISNQSRVDDPVSGSGS